MYRYNSTTKKIDSIFLVVQHVHLHQHTRAARARKSANMVSANTVSVLPKWYGMEQHQQMACNGMACEAYGMDTKGFRSPEWCMVFHAGVFRCRRSEATTEQYTINNKQTNK